MEVKKSRSDCPFSCSLDIWGDKWSLLIIRDMMFAGKSTYGELLKSQEGIATNILAARLLHLEKHGIIEKSEHPESKARYLYSLTEKGISLLPMMVEVFMWCEKYLPVSEELKLRMKIFKENKEEAIREYTHKLTQKL